MNRNTEERSGRGIVSLLIIIGILGSLATMMWRNGFFDGDSKESDSEEVIIATNDETFGVSKQDWNAMQKQLKQLQNEVKTLQNEVKALKQSKPANTPTKSTPANATTDSTPAKTSSATAANAQAITLEKYEHDWLSSSATLSFKNNTDKTITSISGRLVYLDMNGNMLDYVDINKSISIDPGYVKAFELTGYRWENEYAYYKSQTRSSMENRKYKVRFELKSYKTNKHQE